MLVEWPLGRSKTSWLSIYSIDIELIRLYDCMLFKSVMLICKTENFCIDVR